MVERLGPTDVATVKKNPKLKLISQPALAYYSMSINLAADSPLKDPRVRAALEAAIDRSVLNQVVFDGQFIPSNQFEAPGSRYWDPDHPVPPRDLAKAKALLKEAGQEHPAFTLLIGNSPVEQQVGQVVQSMAAEAGFDIKLQAAEANALVAAGRAGNYQATIVIWSGRPDPGRQRGDLARLRRLPELGQILQSEIRRPAGARARRDRRGAASGAVPAAGRYLSRRPAAHRAVSCEVAVGAVGQGVRLHADAGRADPTAGNDASRHDDTHRRQAAAGRSLRAAQDRRIQDRRASADLFAGGRAVAPLARRRA